MAAQIDGIIIRRRSLIGPVTVTDKVIAAGDLEAVAETSTELQSQMSATAMSYVDVWTTYRLVPVVNTSVNDSDPDAFAINALLVQLAHTSGKVGGVAVGRRIVGVRVDFHRRQGHLLVQPDIDHIGQFVEGVNVELLGRDGDAMEDVAFESTDDLDALLMVSQQRQSCGGVRECLPECC
jgi:hypothetical protein